MREIEDVLFERWCRRGDARALGELFDAAAPRLLKLAIHLCGDPAEAEDLVQATFVAAIEQREGVDATRPAMPWLSGVLAHKAQQLRRERARAVDPERLAERAQPDAGAALEKRELDGEVAKALDRLGEPYRQVLLLRLRHGLAVADIAHVLERDPGTVRVQLHRGLERLRAVLPATLASALIVGSLAPRGLAAVKAEVLGAAELVAGTSLSIFGGLVMSKVVVAVAVAGVAAIAWFASGLGANEAARPQEPGTSRAETPVREPLVSSSAEPPGPSDTDRAAVSSPRAPEHVLRGTVVDAESGAPLPGARLRLFAPREAYGRDLVRKVPELYRIGQKGELLSRTAGDWPRIEASGPSRFGRERVRVHDRPEPGQQPLAETITTSSGGFELASPSESAVLECVLEGYSTRWRAVDATECEGKVELWPVREVRGIVLGARGGARVPLESVDVMLWSIRATGTSPIAVEIPHETIGAWSARTGPDGRFVARIGAEDLFATASARGWGPPSTGTVLRQRHDESEIRIVLAAAPAIRVVDEADGAPIEQVQLVGRERRDGFIRVSGLFEAPQGYLQLPESALPLGFGGGSELTFQVWAEGYDPAFFDLAGAPEAIDVRMRRGESPAVDGLLLLDGEPIAGAEVALIVYRTISWRFNEDWLVDSARTASDGSFRLTAAKGTYMLRVLRESGPFSRNVTFEWNPHGSWFECPIPGREPWIQRIQLPAPERCIIDLGRAAVIRASVVGAADEPRHEYTVALSDGSGRSETLFTDENGVATFRNLPAGKYRVMAPHGDRIGSFVDSAHQDVELAPGETRDVRIVRPVSSEPRFARVTSSVDSSFESWTAKSMYEETVELDADGRIPLDLAKAPTWMRIEAPDGRSWEAEVPHDAPDGFEIRLSAGEGVYRGELLGPDGSGLASVRVQAGLLGGGGQVTFFTRTDAMGRFELRGLAEGFHGMLFEAPEGADFAPWLNEAWFRTSVTPSKDGTFLSIRFQPRSETIRVRGAVRRSDGAPVAGARIHGQVFETHSGGALRRQAMVHSDGAGSFSLEIASAPEVTVVVYADPRSGTPSLERSFAPTELADALELVVD